jgi:hypothetical protein
MASLEAATEALLAVQAVSPFDVSEALTLIEEQQAQLNDADLILDFLIATDDFEDCGDPYCEECHFERLLRDYKKKYRHE